jgi:hypothetical protein
LDLLLLMVEVMDHTKTKACERDSSGSPQQIKCRVAWVGGGIFLRGLQANGPTPDGPYLDAP